MQIRHARPERPVVDLARARASPPEDKRRRNNANWFYSVRLQRRRTGRAPEPPLFDKTWVLPDIEKV
jgi:hypothetical protein